MPTNKNAQLRYQLLDRCFSDFQRKYFIEDLLDKDNDVHPSVAGHCRRTRTYHQIDRPSEQRARGVIGTGISDSQDEHI